MRKKYNIILSAEEDFARAVAIGVLVKRPLTVWHILIPGIFIFDFLRRSSEIKRYSTLFLFPRKQALTVALDIVKGEDRGKRLSLVEREMEQWLTSLEHYSGRLLRGEMEAINVLVDHYSRLLRAEGTTYHSLVGNAYKIKENYKACVHKITLAEQEIDRAVAEIRGNTHDIWERLRMEEKQVEELRRKEINKIFPTTRLMHNGKNSADHPGHQV